MADAADHASDDEDLDAPLRGGTPAASGGAYARRAAAHDGTTSLPLQRGRDC